MNNLGKISARIMCIYLFLAVFLLNCLLLSQTEPPAQGKDFEPEQFFQFKLQFPNAPNMPEWVDSFKQYYLKQAESGGYSGSANVTKFLLLSPDFKEKESLYDFKKKDNISESSVKSMGFELYGLFCKLYPQGHKKHVKVSDSELLTNEIKYMRGLYLPEPLESAKKRILERGLTGQQIYPLLELEKEIKKYHELSSDDLNGIIQFINQYPESPRIKTLQDLFFPDQLKKCQESGDQKLIPALLALMPKKEASAFYVKTWDDIFAQASNLPFKDQIEYLEPWIQVEGYTFASIEEKIFLTDLLSWSALLYYEDNQKRRAAVSSIAASAILGAIFKDLHDLSFFFKSDWNESMREYQKKMEKHRNNLSQGYLLLLGLGISSFNAAQKEDENAMEKIPPPTTTPPPTKPPLQTKSTQEKIQPAVKPDIKPEKIPLKDDPLYNSSILNAITLLRKYPTSRDILDLFTVFPDSRALETIVTLPDIHEIGAKLDKYLSNLKEEAIQLAMTWLDGQASALQKSRALYILGFFQVPWKGDPGYPPGDVNELNIFYNYYRLRNQPDDPKTYQNNLVSRIIEKDMEALFLYNRICADCPTPASLQSFLSREISNKKYRQNDEVTQYQFLVENLPDLERDKMVDSMFESYNPKWQELASTIYIEHLPSSLNREQIQEVLMGKSPWKKEALIKKLMSGDTHEFIDILADFLKGAFYTKQDSKLISRNMENQLTKDLILGLNQRINWSAVNQQVAIMEQFTRAKILFSAIGGLSLLPPETAMDIVTKQFLINDSFSLFAARWIIESQKNENPVRPILTGLPFTWNSLAAGVITFLKAYFSETPDYSSYLEFCKNAKKEQYWKDLAKLGVEYAKLDIDLNEAETDADSGKKELALKNPISDPEVVKLIDNIRYRSINILKKQEDKPSEKK